MTKLPSWVKVKRGVGTMCTLHTSVVCSVSCRMLNRQLCVNGNVILGGLQIRDVFRLVHCVLSDFVNW